MRYEFRPFRIETDSELVKEFLLDTQKITGTVPNDIARDGEAYVSAIASAQERDLESCAILLENKVIIGFIDFQVSKKDPGMGFIRFDYIVPHKRRLGLGRKLLDYAFEHLRRAGCSKVCLDVAQTNPAAISFYEKNGWTFTDEMKGPFRRMCRSL